jgi:hypothetical protein
VNGPEPGGEKGVVRAAVLSIGIVIGALVVGVMLVPEGEVATLATLSADGAEHETEVWVVEGSVLPGGGPGALYLRAHSLRAGWLQRLRGKPQVMLQRDGTAVPYLAEVAEGAEVRDGVNRAMAAKYGVADRLLARVVDPARSIPVRLVPDPTRESAAREPAGAHAAPH